MRSWGVSSIFAGVGYTILRARPPRSVSMNRREFVRAGAAAGLALSAAGYHVAAAEKPLRVGLIGTGWYGKCSLYRLIQVAPALEIVSLCDVDKRMVAEAAKMVGERT